MTIKGRSGWVALIALAAGCSGNARECDLRANLRAVAGSNAKDCGDVLVGGDTSVVDACAFMAFGNHMPFFATYALQGIDSLVVSGVAGDNQGGVFFLLWDSAPCGGPGCHSVIGESVCNGPSPDTSPTRGASDSPPFTCTDLTYRGQICG